MDAITTLAKMYLGMPHDILEEVDTPETDENERAKIGFQYMEDAAKAGDRESMVFVARAFDTGLNLDDASRRSAKLAIDWYEKIYEKDEDEPDSSEWSVDNAPYTLMARQAEIWLSGEGDIQKDANRAAELYNLAAESAMACMKGKLANKFYMLAEEAYGACSDEE